MKCFLTGYLKRNAGRKVRKTAEKQPDVNSFPLQTLLGHFLCYLLVRKVTAHHFLPQLNRTTVSLISQISPSVRLSTCIYLTVTRTHTSNVPTHAQTPADVSHRELTDTCPLPNCRFTKSAGCGCQAVSDWMPSSCRDSRSWPSCNCRDDAISPAHLLCTSVPKQKTTDSQSAQRK